MLDAESLPLPGFEEDFNPISLQSLSCSASTSCFLRTGTPLALLNSQSLIGSPEFLA
ncbi:hypothetical protein NG798_22560 [Ancylothrix sp. C2]|uniref:hypothetical protein n=1 Tax=Ancylothrix sp. D3o TaxID=2953691 RepID=UPI0021BB1A6B|nr:hypothetical protein [Ancylothrix sp. D3o]MCT7952583.1 hypothetical protein [Ancylothrix sp. D3o]